MKRKFNTGIILLVTILLTGFISCENLSNPTETEIKLTIPTNLKSNESHTNYDHVLLNWTEVEGADGYEVFMDKSADFLSSDKPQKTVSETSTDIALLSSGTYYFRVRAYKNGNGGKSIYSDFSSVVEYICTKPDSKTPPKYVSAVQSKDYENKVLLTWQETGTYRYFIYYNTENDPNTATEYDREAKSGNILIHLSESSTYYFWVKATTTTYEFSEVAICNFISSPITVPQDLSATREYGKNIINLTWQESGAYRYRIYYNTEDKKETAKEADSQTFIDSNSYSFKAKESGTYYFWVVAEDADKTEIGWSQSASCNFTVIKPPAPTNVSVKVIGDKVLISYTEKSGYTYNIYYSDKNNPENSYQAYGKIFNFPKSGTYYFWVTAKDSTGVESDFSYVATCFVSIS